MRMMLEKPPLGTKVRWTDSILDSWSQLNVPARPYTAGSWGPSAAIALIERDGRTWHEDDA